MDPNITSRVYGTGSIGPVFREWVAGQRPPEILIEQAGMALSFSSEEGEAVVAFKVWNAQGEIIYAYRSDLVGLRYPDNAALKQALGGVSVARFTNLDAPENTAEPQTWRGFLEVYAPVHVLNPNAVLGVVEFYQRPEGLRREIARARTLAGLLIGSLAAVGYGMTLYGALWFPKRSQGRRERPLSLSGRKATAVTKNTPMFAGPPDAFSELTEREQEVLSLLSEGLTNREIVERLYLSETTVKHYVSSIFAKLGIRNRVQATLLFRERHKIS
ncbi:MAG: response regulator transcription factor [Chloroflexota bacterium]|nr:response regulator transcription factor [Chloroflexota bacterium]